MISYPNLTQTGETFKTDFLLFVYLFPLTIAQFGSKKYFKVHNDSQMNNAISHTKIDKSSVDLKTLETFKTKKIEIGYINK